MGEMLIKGLQPDTDYAFQVVPINSNNIAGPPSVELQYHTPQDAYAPPLPAIIDARAIGRLLHVVVDKVAAADFSGFEFHASTENGFTPSESTLKQKGDSTTCEFMGSADAQTWYIRVCSYDTSGNKSGYTTQVAAVTATYNAYDTTPPAVPTGLTTSTDVYTEADGTKHAFILAGWAANTEADLSHYEIRIKAGAGGEYSCIGGIRANQHLFQRLIGSVTYYIGVAAIDRNGNKSAFCADVSRLAAADCLSVAKLLAGSITSQAITLAVVDGAGDVKIQAGKTDFGQAVTGLILGIDDSDANRAKFEVYSDANNYLIWDGVKLLVKAANFALDASGNITASNVDLSGTITATSGAVGGFTVDVAEGLYAGVGAGRVQMKPGAGIWAGATALADAPFSVTNAGVLKATAGLIAGSLQVGSGDPHINIDGVNARIESSNYATGAAGWRISKEGNAEFNDIAARGSFKVATFQANSTQAFNGSGWWTPAAGKLLLSCTSVDSPTTFSVDIEDPGGMTHAAAGGLWTAGDIIRIKEPIGSGVQDLWATIADKSDQTTFWRLAVTKDSPAAGINYTFAKAGAVLNYGQGADAKGSLLITADASASPRMSVYTHPASPWNGLTERVRIGNLNGFLGLSSDLYGFGAGDYTANQYMRYDPANGLVIRGHLNANDLEAGIITASTLQTASSGKRFVVSATYNEAYFYGDRGDGGVSQLASIGINAVGSDTVIGRFGGTTSQHTAVYAENDGTRPAIYATVQGFHYAVFAKTLAGAGAVYGESVSGGVGGIFKGNKGAVKLFASNLADAPSHIADLGTLWVTSNGKLYINTTGTTGWELVGSQT